MKRLSVHIFQRTLIAFSAILATLIGIVWVTQALRRFDLVTAKGQAIAVYLGMTVLAVPFLITIVAPFALVLAMVVVLNAMHSDSELVAANAAGVSHRQLLRPFLVLGLMVTALVAWVALWSGPQALQTLRDMTNMVRADIVANVVQPGRFVDIDQDLTFHIRNRGGEGSLEGIFIYDSRDPLYTYTYSAERGRVMEAVGRTLVVMENGTIERSRKEDAAATYVAFGSYAFDLSELQPSGEPAPYKESERTVGELLATPLDDPYRLERANQFAIEIHTRLTTPLYPLAMMFATFLFLGFPRTTRTGRGRAIVGALITTVLSRLAGFGVAGVARTSPDLIPLLYIVPVGLLAIFGGCVLAGVQPFMPARLQILLDDLGGFARGAFARVSGRETIR